MRFDRRHVQGPDAGFLGGEIEVTTITGSVERFLTDRSGSYRLPSVSSVNFRNSSYVTTVLSSSDHEVTSLNLWRSGSEPLETTAVPASASMYYSKHGRYRHVIVKKTASVKDLIRLPAGMDGATPVYYVPGKGTDVTSVTGTVAYTSIFNYSLIGSSIKFPAVIPVEVPHRGRIVDLKVWIELMQVSGSSSVDGAGRYPLGNLAIAIRSPNLSGFHAHPIRNDPILKKVFTSDLAEFTAVSDHDPIGRSLFGPDYISPFYRDSFILWEGPGLFEKTSYGPWDADNHTLTRRYPSWQRDRSMRTVFSDGAAIPNPRHAVPGGSSGSYNGAPNSYFGFNSAFGFDVPWTSAAEISGANTYQMAGSPPKGWLNGPGGTNLIDEWPTTGVNYGAEQLRPLYPLLDPLYQRKRYGDIPVRLTTGSALFDPGRWTGFRPGLRGTEASGTWYLMIGDNRFTLSGTNGTYTPTYFQQVRLEFILASGSESEFTLRRQSRVRARRARSEVLILTISGSDFLTGMTGSWDAHTSDTYLADDQVWPEIGRTIGITLLTGSAENADFALYYRLSGSLADISGTTPGWLLNNQFAVPVIPISSASLVEFTTTAVNSINPQEIITVRPAIDSAQRLAEAAEDVQPLKTRVAVLAELLSGSSS
jgi:hypothetical protein